MTDIAPLIGRAIAAAAPHVDLSVWVPALSVPMARSGITSIRRIAMFVGQVTEESGDFRALTEDLYYTTAARIQAVWPSYFADQGEASPFICAPQALANHVYASRMGNGNAATGDGWRYRGRGLIQITGKNMYAMFAKSEPRAADPDWLSTPTGAAVSACWFWTMPNLRPSLNALSDAWDVSLVTERINGGEGGEMARSLACEAALRALEAPVAVQPPSADDLNAQVLAGNFTPRSN